MTRRKLLKSLLLTVAGCTFFPAQYLLSPELRAVAKYLILEAKFQSKFRNPIISIIHYPIIMYTPNRSPYFLDDYVIFTAYDERCKTLGKIYGTVFTNDVNPVKFNRLLKYFQPIMSK